MASTVLIERNQTIATVTLNKPEKLNALDLEMWRGLALAFNELSADDSLRCIILRGAGERAFAAGADIAEFSSARSTVAQARAFADITHAAMQAIVSCRHPVIAMIRGACVGGGLEVASVCDMRICGASSRFGIPVKRLGLVVSYSELDPLVSLVGSAVALEILLEGRVFDAAEALAKRLVNRVVADDDLGKEVDAAAQRIAEGAPLVARWHKKFVRRLADPAPLTAAERDECHACFETEDFRIGYQAFLDKRQAFFTGR
jgi:enoyl-CoA hydratase/carnithine racemase